jgi:hypothetical protein
MVQRLRFEARGRWLTGPSFTSAWRVALVVVDAVHERHAPRHATARQRES